MIDPTDLLTRPDFYEKASKDKGYDIDFAVLIAQLEEKKKLQQELEQKRAELNVITDAIKTEGPTAERITGAKTVKEVVKDLESRVEALEVEVGKVLPGIPNPAFEDVPVGKGEDGNRVVREVGDKPQFDFEAKGHLELGTELGILDFEAGAKVSGSQFYFLKGAAVRLEYALIQYGLEKLQSKGYELVQTPDLARSRYYLGTGYTPKGDEAQIYEINGHDLGLIATAEVTMAGYHADDVFALGDLPKKYAAISHCFRQEAGAYGKYSKGLYRVHQFTKLEMFIYCTQEESAKYHAELLQIEEEIVQELGIPYRVLEMGTGDLGAIAARKYDLEAWMPGRGDYGEITSTSNCTDFQARNLNIRYKATDGKTKYAHMLNGTAVVLSRIPIAILENYQQADGTVVVPEVLRKYMGTDKIVKGGGVN